MLIYILRRLMATIPVMAVVSLLVFSLLFFAPGDPAALIAGDQATPDDIERVRLQLGLDRPFFTQFSSWLARLAQGDLGTSLFTNLPVAEMIAQRIERYVAIVGASRVIAGTDCGFGTFAGYGKIDPAVTWKKLRALREGADIAAGRV